MRNAGAKLAVTLALSLAAVPALLLLVWSFAKGWYWPDLFPQAWSLRAWRYVIAPETGTAAALAGSAAIAFAVMLVSVAVSVPAARILAYREFRFKRAVLFVLLLPVLTPPLASAMGVHSLFLRAGLAETPLGIVLIHLIQAAPYATLMMTGSFSRFDRSWEDQARTLGAGWIAIWRHVTLPAIAPGLCVAASFSFLVSWSQYLLTLLIGGGRVITLPLLLVNFQRGGDDAIASALALVYLCPAVLVFVLLGRYLRTPLS